MDKMDMVRTHQLVFEYEKRDEEGNVTGSSRAIDKVDIDVKEGQFIAILGHNGSGKSTLAKHINALLVPTEGTIWVDGKDTKDGEELWKVRQSAGMVFQNPDNQIIGTVVEEDVGFGPENLGVPTDEIWQRVEESLKAVGMLSYRHHSPNKLSGGRWGGGHGAQMHRAGRAYGHAGSNGAERGPGDGTEAAGTEEGDGDPDHP